MAVDYDRVYTLNVSAARDDIGKLKASVETLQQIVGSKAQK